MQGGGGGVVQLLYMVECERALVYTYTWSVLNLHVCMYMYVCRNIYVFNIYTDLYVYTLYT